MDESQQERLDAMKQSELFAELSFISDFLSVGWHADFAFDHFAKEYSYYVSPTGEIICKDGDGNPEQDLAIFVADISTRALQLRKELSRTFSLKPKIISDMAPIMKRTKDEQSTLLMSASSKRQREKLDEIRTLIATRGDDLSLLRELVGYLTDVPPCEATVYAFAHSLWLVKRGIFHMPRSDHQMLILYGSQGIGKTRLLPMLFGPIHELIMNNSDMGQIGDSSSVDSYANYAVQIYDELHNADRVGVNSLKNIITADVMHTRLRYDRRKVRKTNWATFFGTTNISIELLLNDSTGMRRFFQIHVSDSYKRHWDKANSIDYLALLRGIDENRENGYCSDIHKYKIQELKDNYRREDEIFEFIESLGLGSFDPANPQELRKVSNGAIVTKFQEFIKENGFESSYTANVSIRRINPYLKNLGFHPYRDNSSRGWLLPVDSLI